MQGVCSGRRALLWRQRSSLPGCGQPPAATNLEIARTTTPREQRAVVTAAATDLVRPLRVEELARKTHSKWNWPTNARRSAVELRMATFSRPHRSETPSAIRFQTGSDTQAFVVESYKRAEILAIETLPAASFEVTPRDVHFSASFPPFHFVKSPPYTIVTDESFGEVQKILWPRRPREQLHPAFAPLIKQDGELRNIHVVFFGSEEAFRKYALRVAAILRHSAASSLPARTVSHCQSVGDVPVMRTRRGRLDERSRRFSNFTDAGPQLAALRPT